MELETDDEDGLRLSGQIGTLQRISPKNHFNIIPCLIRFKPLSKIKEYFMIIVRCHQRDI